MRKTRKCAFCGKEFTCNSGSQMVSQSTFNFWARTFQITQFIYLPWLNHPTRIGLVLVPFCIDPVKISIIFGIYFAYVSGEHDP